MNNWQLYGLIALAGVLAGGYATGLYYRVEIASIREEQAKAVMDAQARVIQVQKDQAKKTAEVSHGYQIRIAELRKRYSGVQPPAGPRGLPGIPHAAGGHNGTPGNDGLPWRTPEITNLMFRADEQTQRLIACQAWIRAQHD